MITTFSPKKGNNFRPALSSSSSGKLKRTRVVRRSIQQQPKKETLYYYYYYYYYYIKQNIYIKLSRSCLACLIGMSCIYRRLYIHDRERYSTDYFSTFVFHYLDLGCIFILPFSCPMDAQTIFLLCSSQTLPHRITAVLYPPPRH